MSMLLEQFDTIFDTPESVDKLKDLILDMAVKGKLVSQNENDEPANLLLKKVKEKKKQLIKEKKVKRAKPLSPIVEIEKVYELPKGWEWVRLGECILDIVGGGTPSKSNPSYWNGDISWASVKDVKEKLYIDQTIDKISIDGLQNSSAKLIPKGNIILCTRMGLGKICINEIDLAINQDLKAVFLPQEIDKLYFLYYYKNLNIKGTGTTVKGIRQDALLNLLVPIPPLDEQKRIVEKVHQLMNFCEDLKKHLEKKKLQEGKLNISAFSSLEQSSTPEELKESLKFILVNFSSICTDKKHVQQLKNVILSLAVKGTLVSQDLDDEPAIKLLEKIKEEKESLVKENKIKKEKAIPPLNEEEKPYDLPSKWEWVRLQDLCELITKGSSPKWQGVNYINNNEGVLFITSENVGKYSLILNNKKYLEWKFNEIEPRSILRKNDILMNIVGGSIGRTAIYKLDEVANINQAVCLIRVLNKYIFTPYLLHFFNSPTCVNYMFEKQVDTARPNLSMSNIAKFLIPLPPIKEQKRIVEKVDQLMALCDELEDKIKHSYEQQEGLLQSLLYHVLLEQDKHNELIEA